MNHDEHDGHEMPFDNVVNVVTVVVDKVHAEAD